MDETCEVSFPYRSLVGCTKTFWVKDKGTNLSYWRNVLVRNYKWGSRPQMCNINGSDQSNVWLELLFSWYFVIGHLYQTSNLLINLRWIIQYVPPEQFPVAVPGRRPPPSLPNGNGYPQQSHNQPRGAPTRDLPPTPQEEEDDEPNSDYEGMSAVLLSLSVQTVVQSCLPITH